MSLQDISRMSSSFICTLLLRDLTRSLCFSRYLFSPISAPESVTVDGMKTHLDAVTVRAEAKTEAMAEARGRSLNS